MKNHKPDLLIDQTVAWLTRRKGGTITDDLIGKFLSTFFRRKKSSDLTLMREVVALIEARRKGKCPMCNK